MPWVIRHFVAISLVAAALGLTGAFFIVATPRFQPPGNPHLVNMASEDHYTDSEIRRAFAREGIALVLRNRIEGITFFGDRHASRVDDGFLVSKFAPNSTVSFNSSGPKMMFEKRLGNVDISYGGHDAALAARVAAAVAALKH